MAGLEIGRKRSGTMGKGVKAAVLAAAVFVGASLAVPAATVRLEPAGNTAAAAGVAEKKPVYTLRVYDRGVAVFYGDEAVPVMETDIMLSSLRKADRERLENGITVEKYADVLGLLEDFGC